MKEQLYDIVGIESPCMDFAVLVDALPKPNLGANMEDFSWQGGGKVSSGMVAAARLGAKCSIMGSIGDDIFGQACVNDFKRHGIDTGALTIKKGTTSLSLVMSDEETHGRSIIHKAGSGSVIIEEEIDYARIQSTRYFFLSKFTPYNIKGCKSAKAHGTKVFMDADSYSDNMREYVPLIDVFVASEFVYNAFFNNQNYEENCKAIMAMGPEIVVFTFGEHGCVGMDREGFFTLPAFSVPVVDTLGAGDVYHGAFLAGLLQGWSTVEVARFASAVAAIKCTRPGGRSGIPDMKMTLDFLNTGKIDFTGLDERLEAYRRGLELHA